MERLRLTPVLAALLAILSLPGAVRADLYRWVDSQGNVHISDTPPPGGAAKVPSKPVQEEPADTEVEVERAVSGRYRGTAPSRMIALENVATQFENESERPRTLSGCARYNYNQVNSIARGVSFPSAFYGRLEELGYTTPRSDQLKFAREEKGSAELSAIALIRDVSLASCTRVQSLDVEWRLYDNLHRKVALEVSVVGRDKVDPGEIRRSLLEAFADALNSLAKDRSFQALMKGEHVAVASADDSGEGELAPLSMAIRFGAGKSTFSSRVESLKSGSVTVRTPGGHGSGFLLSPSGHVLTNAHVVAGSKRVVIVFDEQEIDGTVVRQDVKRDVALVQLSSKAPALPLEISRSAPREGDTLYAMGTPLDESLSHTVTRGILSAKRTIAEQAFYQTDAAINHGNSGGPIFDERGDVVAIAVAGVFTKDAGATSINLLIPIQDALDALEVRNESPGLLKAR